MEKSILLVSVPRFLRPLSGQPHYFVLYRAQLQMALEIINPFYGVHIPHSSSFNSNSNKSEQDEKITWLNGSYGPITYYIYNKEQCHTATKQQQLLLLLPRVLIGGSAQRDHYNRHLDLGFK